MKRTTLLFVFLLGIMTVTCFAQDKDASEYMALAKKGDADAQAELGLCYYEGKGVDKNYDEAVKWYRLAVEPGNEKAQNRLGNCYYYGNGVEQDYVEAVKWFRMAAEQEYAEAQNNLGFCYHRGYGVPQNYTEAVKWFRMAAEQGYASAQYNLGVCYKFANGVPQDYVEAVKWYTKAAEQNQADAQNNLGVCYRNGYGVPQNYAEAFKWYTKAAENGSTDAMMNIGDMYRDGTFVEQDYKKAESYYMKAVNKGSSDAMIKMGDLCRYYKIESRQAKEWYNLAIEQGNPDAIAALADMYDSDLGYYDTNDTLKQYTERLWQNAADKGSARAQAIIGFKCFLEKNFDKAMEWYAKAKKNGATYVWRVVNVNLPIDMAIMLCEHFKNHSAEYNFYFRIDHWFDEASCYGWLVDVFPCNVFGPDGFFGSYVPKDYVYVAITKNDKIGLIKLTKDGKLLEKTPIIYDMDYGFYYYEDDENGKFHTWFNGQEVKFDL